MVCPKCGSSLLRITNATSARFYIDDETGKPTEPDVSSAGRNYIKNNASDFPSNMLYVCLSCCSSFEVNEKDGKFQIGEED